MREAPVTPALFYKQGKKVLTRCGVLFPSPQDPPALTEGVPRPRQARATVRVTHRRLFELEGTSPTWQLSLTARSQSRHAERLAIVSIVQMGTVSGSRVRSAGSPVAASAGLGVAHGLRLPVGQPGKRG